MGEVLWERPRPRRESTGTTKETGAKRFLQEREGRVATGQSILQRADRISYVEVAQDLRQHYHLTGSCDLGEAEDRLKHLDAFFAGKRVATIGAADIIAFVAKRQGDRASNSTINRDLAVLNRMMR